MVLHRPLHMYHLPVSVPFCRITYQSLPNLSSSRRRMRLDCTVCVQCSLICLRVPDAYHDLNGRVEILENTCPVIKPEQCMCRITWLISKIISVVGMHGTV